MRPRDHASHARSLRQEGELRAAGDYYLASGFGNLMEFRRTEGDPISPKEFGRAIQMLLLGALGLRCAGETSRAACYCSIGSDIVADIRTNEPAFLEPEADAPVGLTHEFEADFRTVGGFGDPGESYELARERYERVAEQHRWSVEPEFEMPLLVLFDLAETTEFDVSDDLDAAVRTSLVDRIEFKREHFGTIIDRVIEDENWESKTW